MNLCNHIDEMVVAFKAQLQRLVVEDAMLLRDQLHRTTNTTILRYTFRNAAAEGKV